MLEKLLDLMKPKSSYARITCYIDAGRYDPNYHHNMRSDQYAAEKKRVQDLFRYDVLHEFEMQNPLGERLFRISWDTFGNESYRNVLEHFVQQLRQDVE